MVPALHVAWRKRNKRKTDFSAFFSNGSPPATSRCVNSHMKDLGCCPLLFHFIFVSICELELIFYRYISFHHFSSSPCFLKIFFKHWVESLALLRFSSFNLLPHRHSTRHFLLISSSRPTTSPRLFPSSSCSSRFLLLPCSPS